MVTRSVRRQSAVVSTKSATGLNAQPRSRERRHLAATGATPMTGHARLIQTSASTAYNTRRTLGLRAGKRRQRLAEHQNITEWRGKNLVDRDGEKIGKLEDVYVDVETDEPMFGTVKESLIGRQ
jgi:hypothetical protein